MAQVSWRADNEIVKRAKHAAARSNRSLNEYITLVVSAASNPDFAGSESEAVRERLAAAGLLGATKAPRSRPSDAEVKAILAHNQKGARLCGWRK